jgi:hypothetical protein
MRVQLSSLRLSVPVDIRSYVVIHCPPDDVASYAIDADNATSWYKTHQVGGVEVAQAAGCSRVAFAALVGRRLGYTYEI